MRLLKRLVAAVGGGVALGLLIAAPAFAGTITTPSSNPFTIPVDGSGNPVSFTVSGGGFNAGGQVYIEECDGVSPTSPGWSPTLHCDNATSPSAVTADSNGNYTFPAGDPNFGFTPFPNGLSPSGQFNCIAPGQTPPSNGHTSYTNCQVRVSSNNGSTTSDQAFITLTYPQQGAITPEVPYAVILPLGALALGGAFFLIHKRRASSAATA